MSTSTVIFLTKDLFFIPIIKQAAERSGHALIVSPSVDNSRLDSIDSAQVSACVLDLTSVGADAVEGVGRNLKTRFPQAKLAAFGPHVHEQHLALAQSAGFDHVLTRGQLNKNPDHWLALWTSKPDQNE